MIALSANTGELFLTILAVLFTIDCLCSLVVLAIVFNSEEEENSLMECLGKEDNTKMKKFNDRVPEILQEGETA